MCVLLLVQDSPCDSGSQGKSEMWCYFHYTALYFLLLMYIYTFLTLHVYIYIYKNLYTYIFLYLYIHIFIYSHILFIHIYGRACFLLTFLFNFVLLFHISFLLGALTSLCVSVGGGCAPQLAPGYGFPFHKPRLFPASNPLLHGINFTFCQNYISRAQSSLLSRDARILGGRWVHIKEEKRFVLQVRLQEKF